MKRLAPQSGGWPKAGRPFPLVGVMGSPAKLKAIFDRLREHGFTDEHLDRLKAPVGLAIGSNTPEEIAVSVAAQILQQRGIVAPYRENNRGCSKRDENY